MSERQVKNYGLRRAAAPKKYDSDFEYYYNKSKDSPLVKEENPESKSITLEFSDDDSPKRSYEVVVESVDTPESPSKKPRGRPKKCSVPEQAEYVIPDEADLDENYVHLKSKRDKKHREERVEECVESVIESLEQGMGEELLIEEVIPQGETHVIISADPEDEKRIHLEELQRVHDIMEAEQAVISLPMQDGKDNPDNLEIEHTETISGDAGEEILMLGIGSDEDGQLHQFSDVRVEVGSDGVAVATRKPKRKYKRIKGNADTIRHLKEFGAEDKIECHECHKLLKPSSYRQHLKTHSGVKPFGCEVCEARFTRKGDVERHIRIVHNKQKPFSCHRCPRSFGDKKNLRWHLMNHDKKLFYVCETCGFKFGKREYYENHVRFIHPLADDGSFGEEDETSLPETLLSTTMEIEGELVSGPLNMQNFSNVIKKGSSLLSVLESTEDGETLEITEDQLQSLLQQGAYGKNITVVNSTRRTKSKATFVPRAPKNSQVVSFKDLESMTNIPNDFISKLQKNEGIEAVVIQIEGNPVDDDGEEQGQTMEEEEDHIMIPEHEIEHTKEVNIVVSKSSSLQEGAEPADANVQSLIDALLDAAKDSATP